MSSRGWVVNEVIGMGIVNPRFITPQTIHNPMFVDCDDNSLKEYLSLSLERADFDQDLVNSIIKEINRRESENNGK